MTGTAAARAIDRVLLGGDDPAVVDAAGVASTTALRALVEAFAGGLAGAGVARGDRVAVLLERGREETAALLAIWSAGASAVPLDAGSPDLRNRRILDGAGVRTAIADEAAARRLGVTAVRRSTTRTDAGARLADVPGDEAIVLHTSGSSGVPKGVPVTHCGVTAFADWMTSEFDVRAGDAVAALASLTFDLALFEQLAPLAAGGVIVRPDDRTLLSATRTARFLDGVGTTCVYAVPSLYVRLLDAGALPEFAALRTVLFAGESFPVKSLRALRAALPGRVFANLFGPTETNVSTFHRLREDDPPDDGVPIGVPCPYVETAIVPSEVASSSVARSVSEGELTVRGPTVLAGYVGADAPALRRVRVEGRGDERFLATGDRVARGADGLLQFRGRIDGLLKVRGYRVEPGEVEAALTSHAAVADAVVRRDVHPSLGEILVADVAPRPDAVVEVRELRAHVAARVPAYMVPTEVQFVAELPRSERGKRGRRPPGTDADDPFGAARRSP